MHEANPANELEILRSEVEALRLANAAVQDQMSIDAEQTAKILRAIETQATALKVANQRRVDQANFTQRVMDTTSSLMIVLKSDGRIRLVNQRFAAEFCLAGKSLEDRVLDDWLHPDERQQFAASVVGLPWRVHSPLFEFLRQAGSYAAEHRLTPRDGEYRFYWLEATLQHDPQGKEEGAVVCATDITTLKQQQDRLRHSEGRLKEAQRLAQLGHWELDWIADRASFSEEVLRIHESGTAPGTYGDWIALVHPDDRAMVDQAFTSSVQDRRLFDTHHRLLFSDGRVKWVHVRGGTEHDSDGRPLRSVGTVQDVTARHSADEELSLAASVFESSLNGVVITDANACIVKTNKAFNRILGYSSDEIIGKKTSLFNSRKHDVSFFKQLWSTLQSEGEWQGEIWDRRKDGVVIPLWQSISAVRDPMGSIKHYIGVIYDLSDQKRSAAHIHHLAYYDALTDLPNRQLFADRCHEALERSRLEGKSLFLLFLDLDRFKYVNDSLGHPVGDELLRAVARRLTKCLRHTDTVARLGGDEFIVLLQDSRGRNDAKRVARKIIKVLVQPFFVQDHKLDIGASIGISCYPGDGDDAPTLIKNADLAMYQAKDEGRGTFRFYEAQLSARSKERLFLEGELREALKRDELSVHYQPLYDLSDGKLVGAEALLRWRHGVRGMIPPDRFIPIAEDAGLIVQIGEWVLRAACQQAQMWRRSGFSAFRIAVNLSGVQIERCNIVETVARILDETGLPPECLELEITETYVMRQAQQSVRVLDALRALGVSLAIDDFGTGQSSLSYLKQLPVDKLKIDRSFIADIPNSENEAAITRAIVALGHGLRLKVLAEGIETPEQAAFLKELGCDEGQGYHLGRPMDAASFGALLNLAEPGLPTPNSEKDKPKPEKAQCRSGGPKPARRFVQAPPEDHFPAAAATS